MCLCAKILLILPYNPYNQQRLLFLNHQLSKVVEFSSIYIFSKPHKHQSLYPQRLLFLNHQLSEVVEFSSIYIFSKYYSHHTQKLLFINGQLSDVVEFSSIYIFSKPHKHQSLYYPQMTTHRTTHPTHDSLETYSSDVESPIHQESRYCSHQSTFDVVAEGWLYSWHSCSQMDEVDQLSCLCCFVT